jgi:molecular chaperone GrpE
MRVPRVYQRCRMFCADPNAGRSIEEVVADIKKSEARVAELKEKLTMADEDAAQSAKRYMLDLDNASKYAIVPMARDLLSIHDNLKRAIGCLSEEDKVQSKEIREILKALSHTENLLTETLEEVGIEETDPLGEMFDPNYHEALFEFPNPERKTGEIGHVMNTGFTIHERVLRAAKVGVTRNPQ